MGIKTQVDHNVKLCRLHTSVNSYRTSPQNLQHTGNH